MADQDTPPPTITARRSLSLRRENTISGEDSKKMQNSNEVSTAGGINQVPSTPSAHDIAYSFLAQPTTSPQLENEDFQQMDGDDLEELDLLMQVGSDYKK
ncbi:hypothetical protein Tco_1097119 [Tanacetum coccineum]